VANSLKEETTINKLSKEPTVHFFVIAMVIFAIYGISSLKNDNLLEVDQREIDARIFMQEMATGQDLSNDQREFIASRYVEEQILVREAIAIGLDNDARIHDMLAQKMRHVLSGDVIQPTQEELNEYYHNNIEAYQTLPSVSVNEIVLNNRDEIPNAAQQLLEQGASANEILDLSPGAAAPLPNVNHIDLSNIFDPEFADDVFNAQTSAWVGPFLSNRGQHFLQITERTDARLSPLEEILDRVRLDWITQEEEVRLQEEINKLWEQYTIIVDNTNAEQH
jgi:hypothetical protein